MFDPTHLRSFLAVESARNFTAAARRLGLRQSTVSQHVAKLEQAAGRRLLLRDTHSMELTADGAAMLGFAREILEREEAARRYFSESTLRGRVRFGASEDLVLHELPTVLAEFRRDHPRVDLELTVALSEDLNQLMADGHLDIAFGKQRSGLGDRDPRVVFSDELVLHSAPGFVLDDGEPIPFVTYPPPALTRAIALEMFRRAGIPHRITCTSGSLNGLRAAALAGMGVVLHAAGMPPDGLVPFEHPSCRPCGPIDVVLTTRRSVPSAPEEALVRAIRANADRLAPGRRRR